MELGAAESVELPYYTTIKVHRLMCLELKKLVDSILHVVSALEAARPRCASGIQALCSLQSAIDKAKLLIQHCSECSKLYLATTAKAIHLRCENIRQTLEICMIQVQDMVPVFLAAKISGIIDELRGARFPLEPSEYEAGTVILALLKQYISASSSKMQSEIQALRLAALRLNILSPFALSIEQRSIKKLLGKVHDTNPTKREVLKYLLYLLKRHGRLIWRFWASKSIVPPEEESFNSSMKFEQGVKKEEDEASANEFFITEPPEQFKCPMSMRLLYDPVTIASGKTLERVWIEKWFNEGNQMCPVTNIKLEQLSLTPNLAIKGFISDWCFRHGIHIPENPPPIPSLPSLRKPSSSSISSFYGSVLGSQLRIGSVLLGSTSTESSFNSSEEKYNDGITSGQPQVATASGNQRHHHSSMTSSNDMNAAFLSELDKHSWGSQCKTVENVKGLLKNNDEVQHLTFSNSYIIPLIKFLKDANEICDIKRQKDGVEVLLAILSSASRIELPPCHEDFIYLLASMLDSEPARESLAILEVLSWQQYYKSRIVASGVLPSILKILDTTFTEFYMLAMKILRNLSNGSDVGYHIAYLGYVPKLVSFLEDSNVAGYCIEIINNLCNIEEARIEVAEANLCSSIATILEAGNKEEQEVAVDVLLSLSYDNTGFCQMVKNSENIIQSLFTISINGSSKGSENASLLLNLLGFMTKSDASQCSLLSVFLSQENSHVSSTSNGFKVTKRCSKAFGCLRKKLSRFFHAQC